MTWRALVGRTMFRRLAIALILFSTARPAAAEPIAPARPRLQATRMDRPPVIDGRIDEAAWRLVPASDAYTQKFPQEGERPTEKTLLRVAYDDEAVYVAIDCEQRLAPIVRRLTRRDRIVEADWVSVIFDTRRDGKSAFVFNVNAAGVLSDMIRFDDTSMSFDWDENWEARTALTATGWSAELRIPLRILRFSSLPLQSWGFQSRRYVSQRQETDEWAFIPRSAAAEVSMYGQLDELRGLRPGHGVEVSPFVWGRVRRRDAEASRLARGTDLTAAAGLDVKWHPSQELTVDAAFLPDFGQVESDQVVLNLSNFETEYPEKRRFFLEGIDTFATPEIALLYTRRIGRAAPVPVLREGEQLVDQPGPATIYGALKLTGRVGRWEVGALSAVTGRNEVEVQGPDGTRTHRLADPLSIFNVLRVKRALGDNGHVGLLATSVVRSDTAGGPLVTDPVAGQQILCADGRQVGPGQRCANDAHVAGLDYRWRSPSGDYTSVGQLVGSLLERGPARTVPDGTVVAPGDVGSAVRLVLNKDGGAHWLWNVWAARDSRKLTVNDAGYLDRANLVGTGGQLILRSVQPWSHTLESALKLEGVFLDNIDGLPTQRTALLTAQARLPSFWAFSVGLGGSRPRFDDREVGDGAALERTGGVGGTLALETDPRARLLIKLDSGIERVTGGGHTVRGELALQLRTLPQLDLELIPQVFFTRGEIRYAAASASGAYLFGKLDARSTGLTMRATYTFTPRLTLQAYAQLFLAARHYSDFASYTPAPGPPAVIHLRDLQVGASAPAANPDKQDTALNANVVLRWEFRTGSLLYLVYTRAQAPQLTLQPGEIGKLDLRSVRRAPAADIILLKLAFWWG
jgi:hypothetical protein